MPQRTSAHNCHRRSLPTVHAPPWGLVGVFGVLVHGYHIALHGGSRGISCFAAGPVPATEVAYKEQEAFDRLCRRVDDYELHKQLYKGKASILYSATCKKSGKHVALKLYRKPRLSDLNWFQVRVPNQVSLRLARSHVSGFGRTSGLLSAGQPRNPAAFRPKAREHH